MTEQPGHIPIKQLIDRIRPDLSILWTTGEATPAAPPEFNPPDPAAPALVQLDTVYTGLRATLMVAHRGEQIEARIEQLADAIEAVIEVAPDTALAYLFLRNKDDYPPRHAIHCAVIACLTATAAERDRQARRPVLCAALTQNISMNALQSELYHLEGELGSLDRLLIRRHPLTAVGVLKALGVDNPDWLEAVALHHERCDGSGYPFGLRGEAIPLNAQLIAAADSYCASVSARGYRAGRPPHEAIRTLFMNGGTVVNEHLGRLLVKTLGLYPPGSVIELRNRQLALVIERGEQMVQPRVLPLGADGEDGEGATLIAADECAPVRVASTDRLPESFDLEQTWLAAEPGHCKAAAGRT